MYKTILALFITLTSTVTAAPRLEVENNIDLGFLPRELILKRTVEYKNTGDETLVIRSWGKSCGCMKVDMGETTLKPGESSSFVVTIDAGLFLPGNVNVTFASNDLTEPNQIVSMKYRFYDPLILSQPVLYIEKSPDESVKHNIFVEIRDFSIYSDYTIEEITTDVSDVTINIEETDKNKFKIELLFDERINRNVDLEVLIKSEGDKFGDYAVPVKVRLSSEVKFYPKKLILQKKVQTKKGDLLAKFRILSEQPKDINSIKSALDILEFKYKKVAKNEYLVECYLGDDIEFDQKYVEHYIISTFKDDKEEYILPFLYVNRLSISSKQEHSP